MEIPDAKAPKKKFDQLYDKHLPLAETCLKLLVPEQLNYYKAKLKKVDDRRKFMEAIPNQARWFIKFQEGISDALKAKCVPRGKATALEVVKCFKAVMARKGEIEKKVIVAAHSYPRNGNDGPAVFVNFKKFAVAYTELVEEFDDFQQDLRDGYKKAVRHEKEAFNVLKKYLEDKNTIKEQLEKKTVSKSDYEKFKKKFLDITNDLE